MENWQDEAFRYYCLGLNSKEIGKLLDKSYRTVQGAMSKENWKQRRAELQEKEEARLYRKFKKQYRNESK